MSHSDAPPSVAAPKPSAAAKRPRLMVAVMTLAALMDMLDVTVVNVALPTLRVRLHASSTQTEWLVAGYLLAFGATLIVWGRLGDRFGRRPIFLAAVGAFGAASLLAGTASTISTLVAFRVLQGAAAGALVPQVLATFRSALDRPGRIAAFGIYGAVAGLAAALGVVLGGVLTQYSVFGLGWRAIFLVNVPVVVLVLAVGAVVIPESRHAAARTAIGWPAVVWLPVSLAAVVYSLLEGNAHNWSTAVLTVLALGVAGVAALVWHEGHRNGARPPASRQLLLDPRQFRIRAFNLGLAVQLLFSVALQGFALTFVLWLQIGHGYTPLHTGLTLLAFSAGAIGTAPNAGKFAEARGRGVLMFGAALLVIGMVIVGIPAWQSAAHVTAWYPLSGLFIAGAGLGLLVVPLVNVVLAAVPESAAGGASGLFTTAQQVGGALGVAVVGTVFFGHRNGAMLNQAFATAVIVVIAAYASAGLLSAYLPRRALSEDRVIDLE